MYRFLSLNLILIPIAFRIIEPTFGAKITTSEKFQYYIKFKIIEKPSSIMSYSLSI